MRVSLAAGVVLLASVCSTMEAQKPQVPGQRDSRSTMAVVESLDWRVQAEDARNLAKIGSSDLRLFVQKQLAVQDSGSGEANHTGDRDICSVAAVDLSGGNTYSILASIDWSGRHFCNDLRLFTKDVTGIKEQRFSAWKVEDVSGLVVDLGGDGKRVLMIPQLFSPYDGAMCVATWTKIYGAAGNGATDVSAEFSAFYRSREQSLRERLNRGEMQPECAQMELDKIERFLGASPTAGFERTQQWMRSGNASLRSKAIVVFGDIADGPSKLELAKIAASGSKEDAAASRIYLESGTSR